MVLQSHVGDLHLKQVWHLDWCLLFSEQFDGRSVLHGLSTIGLGVEGSVVMQSLLAVRLAENPGMRTLRLALGSLFSLFSVRQGISLIDWWQHVDGSHSILDLVGGSALFDLIVDVILLHVLQLAVDALLLSQFRKHFGLFGRLFALTGLFHLLLQLTAVLSLEPLAPVEFLLSDVLEIVSRLHMHLLFPGGR